MEKFIKELKKANEAKKKMIQEKEKKEEEIIKMITCGVDETEKFSRKSIEKRHENKKMFESEITACNNDITALNSEIEVTNLYIKALKNQILEAASNTYFIELLKNEKLFDIPARYKKVKNLLPAEMKENFYIVVSEYCSTIEVNARMNNNIFDGCGFSYEDSAKKYYIKDYNKNDDFYIDREKIEKLVNEYSSIDTKQLFKMCKKHYEAKKKVNAKIEQYKKEIAEIKNSAFVPGLVFGTKEVHF